MSVDFQEPKCCIMCGNVIGYMDDPEANYWSLCARKYCDTCRPIANRNRNTEWYRKKRWDQKQIIQLQAGTLTEYIRQLDMVKEENRLLRIQIMQLRQEVETVLQSQLKP